VEKDVADGLLAPNEQVAQHGLRREESVNPPRAHAIAGFVAAKVNKWLRTARPVKAPV